MSIKDMADKIGLHATWTPSNGVHVDVRIQDVRRAYGRTDYLITPIAGTGETWVTAHTVQLETRA